MTKYHADVRSLTGTPNAFDFHHPDGTPIVVDRTAGKERLFVLNDSDTVVDMSQVAFKDSPNIDAFGRLRISEPVTLFDWTNQYSPSTFANQQFWDVAVVGGGTASPVSNESSIRLSTGGTTDTHAATIQTKQHFQYQPGKSRLVLQTFALGTAVSNGYTEIGYGDANDGVFLKREASAVSLTLRTYTTGSAVDTDVAQASWDDPMDGTGTSGVTLDWTKSQILAIDLEWLGVGRVRCYFVIDGVFYLAHEFKNANAIAKVYMRSGTLPIRARVLNDGTAGGANTMDVICSSVISEGGYETANQPIFSASNNATAITTGTTLVPLVSIRPATSFNSVTFRGAILPISYQVICASQIHEIQLVKNASLGSASFGAVNSTYSAAEVDVAASSISGGIVLDRIYIAASAAQRSADLSDLFAETPIVYTSLNNTQETLTVAARTVTGSGSAYGVISWQERY